MRFSLAMLLLGVMLGACKQEVKICEAYWDGWNFKEGSIQDKRYQKFQIARYGIPVIHVYIPKDMANEMIVDGVPTGEYFKDLIGVCKPS
jgi:hypothetical protein